MRILTLIFIVCSYEHGFPVLDDNLFFIPSSEQPTSPDVDNIKKDSSSTMIAVRSAAEKTKGKQAAEVAHGNAELWAKYVAIIRDAQLD